MPSRKTAFDNADVIFLAGTPLDFRMGYSRRLNPKAMIIILDMDYRNVGYNRDFDIGLVGNVRAILNAMCESSKGDVARKHDPFIRMLREEEEKAKDKNDAIIKAGTRPIHPVRLCHEINEFLLEDTVYIGDGGDIVTFSGSIVKPHKPGGWMDPGPLGTRGHWFCVGVKADSTRARRSSAVWRWVVRAHWFCFETMVRNKLPFVGVIGNNSSWNQINYGQERKYPGRSDVGNILADVRFDKFAEAMGGVGIRVTKPRISVRRSRTRAIPADPPS